MNTNEWQPIETAPKDGTEILVFCYYKDNPKDKIIALTYWWYMIDGWHEIRHEEYLNITHWMPLPEPPKTK